MDIDDKIKPFILVEHESGSISMILNVGDYKNEIFQARENEGFEGNGYDWASLALVFLEERLPELKGIINFDPEGSMFCAYSNDKNAMHKFAIEFKNACENDELINDLFSRADLD